jgi:hypothetical protein
VLATGLALTGLLGAIAWRHGAAARPAEPAGKRAARRPAPPIAREGGARAALANWLALGAVVLLPIQLVPGTRDNPPVQTEMAWDSAESEQLWDRACGACHTNETRWPWYSRFAPPSWLLVGHVHAARNDLNLSEFDEFPAERKGRLPEQLARVIRSGRMPPRDFLLMHPEARLTEEESERLILGLERTLQSQAQAPR